MELSPLVLQWREEAVREGMRAERRVIIENLLKVRFGSLDDELSAIIEPMLELPNEEFIQIIMQLSRDELLARFGKGL